jgi:CubicO group peptidase (beta-lactamase class C family)
VVLKNGKIVLEKYFDTFTRDSLWYWASAGKSLTAFMIGITKEQNNVDIEQASSMYLGNGWSSCTQAQEQAIKVKHHLSMTTGINDNVADLNCVDSTCLQYLTAPNTRWAYHNAPYYLLHNVIENVSNQSLQQYTNQKLKNVIGMSSGTWFNNIFYSKTLDAARFGQLMLSNAKWNNTVLINDTSYLFAMRNTSNAFNLSYGYLWWLNGKANYMIPQTQFVVNNSLASWAAPDMYAAMGKYDQKIYIIPSQQMVVVRFGNATNSMLAVSEFDNALWQRMALLNCNTSSVENVNENNQILVLQNNKHIFLNNNNAFNIKVFNAMGACVFSKNNVLQYNFSSLKTGIYFYEIQANNKFMKSKFVVAE